MLRIEQAIAHDIGGKYVAGTGQLEAPLHEKLNLTTMAVPEALMREENSASNLHRADEDDDADMLAATAGRNHSLVEFMQIEDRLRQGTLRSIGGFAGESFRDDFADSIGTQLTEIVDTGRRAGEDSILREE